MGIVCGPHLDGPFLHTGCNLVGDTAIQWCTVVNHIGQFAEHMAWQVLKHLFLVENVHPEVFRRAFGGSCHFYGFFLKGRFYDSESEF